MPAVAGQGAARRSSAARERLSIGAPLAPAPDERHIGRASPRRRAMSTAVPQPQPQPQPQQFHPTPREQGKHFGEEPLPELRIYSHSNLIYWWPVWVVGYAMAAITYFQNNLVTFG